MLNEKLLLQTLKTNFEKLNKTKLSEFENDLYSVKKIPFLTLTKDNLVKFKTYGDGYERVIFGYKQSPKINWLQNLNYISYHLEMRSTTGAYINCTEVEQPIYYEKIPIPPKYTEDESLDISYAEILYLPNVEGEIKITNGVADNSLNVNENSFYIEVFQDIQQFTRCIDFKLELYRVEYKRIPLENLEIDEFKKLPINYIDLTSLDEKFAPIINPKFGNTVRIGKHKNYTDNEFENYYGENSVSIGAFSQSPGYCSFSQGYNTIAYSNLQHVIGRYNKTDYNGYGYGKIESDIPENRDIAFAIGNGLDEQNRSNAHMVNFNGDAWYAGNVYTGKDLNKAEKLVTEKEARDYITQPIDSICLVDSSTGYQHIIQFINGKLASFMKTISIVTKVQPTKTDYSDTDEFDATGMKISAICQDGSERDVTDYIICDKYVTINSTVHKIIYRENGNEYITTVPITTRTLEQALVDFEYIINGDGTFTLTEWKETFNGNPSQDKLVIPNSAKIRL